MICKVRWLKSEVKTGSFVEDLRTFHTEEFKDFKFDILVGIWKLRNASWETVWSDIMAM